MCSSFGEPECFDDWCIAVVRARRRDSVEQVTVRVSNRGAGKSQAEPDAFVYLRGADGTKIDAQLSAPDAQRIGDAVSAGAYHDVDVEFALPSTMTRASLVKTRHAKFPSIIVIGDPSSVMHSPAVHALQ